MHFDQEENIGAIMRNAKKLLYNSSTSHLDIELLLAHALQTNRLKVISNSELILSKEQQRKFYQLLEKRAQGKSIAQILGKQEFWKHEFIVSEHTLVPRPDSETLISTLLKLYPNKKSALAIADFGTGSGCLIISMLLEYKNAHGIAFEKSKLAHNTAYKNLKLHKLSSRLNIILGSWEKCNRKVDIIISNPPYIKKSSISSLPNAISKYEPKLSLDGGDNGLNCYHSIIKIAEKYLKRGGRLLLEIGNEKQLLQVKKIIQPTNLQFYKSYPDLSGETRCVIIK